MKLVTCKDGSRDGLLALVLRDLDRAHFAAGIERTRQQAQESVQSSVLGATCQRVQLAPHECDA